MLRLSISRARATLPKVPTSSPRLTRTKMDSWIRQKLMLTSSKWDAMFQLSFGGMKIRIRTEGFLGKSSVDPREPKHQVPKKSFKPINQRLIE